MSDKRTKTAIYWQTVSLCPSMPCCRPEPGMFSALASAFLLLSHRTCSRLPAFYGNLWHALSKGGQEACQKFTECRHSHGMSQKQRAEALGISYGLVKRIEARTIACSERTMLKAQKFMDACDTRPDAPDRHGLEEHVLYDVFLTNMRQIPVKEASEYAGKCTRSLLAALSKASGCTSPDAQKRYFEFLECSLASPAPPPGNPLKP